MTPPVRRARVALILLSGWPRASPGQALPAASPAFDVTVERTLVSESGVVEHRGPTIRYRLAEVEGPDGRAMEMRFQPTTPFPGRGPLADPAAGFRVVMHESGSVRIFDATGRQVEPLDAGALPRMTPLPAREAGGGPALPRRASERLRALVSRYGSPQERDGAHVRYRRLDGDLAEEAVVQAATGCPWRW